MSKFNYFGTIDKIKASYGKDPKVNNKIGTASTLESASQDPKDHVVMPEWWWRQYGVWGIPFGKWVQISGKPDAGKTSLSLLAIKQAQSQGHVVVYVETEGKTDQERLMSLGINPDEVIVVNTALTEEMYKAVNKTLDAIQSSVQEAQTQHAYEIQEAKRANNQELLQQLGEFVAPKVLLVIDSYGNTTSLRDSQIDQTEKVAMVGGAAKSNRLGLGAIRARQEEMDIAVLIVNYSYANLGSVGETNAGGRALEFFCSLIINAARKGDYYRTVKGEKVKAGTDVLWKTTKNHFAIGLKNPEGGSIMLPKELVLRITSDGMNPAS